jgi:type IV secretory pathway TrbD component
MSNRSPDGSHVTTRFSVDRERIVRTLTFWLRPAFVLRVLNRFQLIAGFDRAMALASSALTALIPLAVLTGAVLPHVQAEHVADWLIQRYGLTGGGAEALKYGVVGAVFAMISALFGFMLFLVASAALGREVVDELNRIRVGERPPDDEVRREWDALIREARSRWEVARDHVDRIRRKLPPPGTVQASPDRKPRVDSAPPAGRSRA